MSDYWDTYGTGDAWCDRFGNQVDPRTFENEDALQAAGYHHVNQRGGADWIARELGTVERRPVDWFGETVTIPDGPTAYGIVWGQPGIVPVESLGR
jgi:hypothetical protein